MTLTGGCLCGKVRYRCSGDPQWIGHCHCRSCQRHSGAAFMTFLLFEETEMVIWLGEKPQAYASSPGVERGFCGHCGSTLSFARPERNEFSVLAGTLDDPGAVRPTMHVFVDHQCRWLKLDDGLPVHGRFPPHAADRDIDPQ